MTLDRIVRSLVILVLLPAAALAAPPTRTPSLFVDSDRCMACHNGLLTPAGEDVSIGSDWRASMMAHAALDPYWQASVRRETLVQPAAAAAIEHECAACHMPMSRFEADVAGGHLSVFAQLAPAGAATPTGRLAADGVSCAICHQITDEGLGEPASFTGGFAVDTTTPLGSRAAYGPYEVDAGRRMLMRSAALLQPEQAAHVQSSELCATCHTLYTHALDDDGEVVGELPEQVPYLEWKHSAYAGVVDCQYCHMPVVDEPVAIASTLGIEREQVSRHVFRGGNFFMPRLLEFLRADLGLQASPGELAASAARTADHLRSSSAVVDLTAELAGPRRLDARVRVTNLAGHKLPTAYPSRRAWLHVVVRDRGGRVVFESGRLRPDGSIEGNDNDDDATRFEPHYRMIAGADQVQIYEPILAGPDGAVTTVLLRAVRYAKDNRLPPDGFDVTTAPADVAVRGGARDDDDFTGGVDEVEYRVELGDAIGPFSVDAELWYQPIGFRWARNLERQNAPEIERFVTGYDALAERSGLVLARAEATVR